VSRVLLDEHVGRVFERVLRERGHEVVQAKDVFGEETNDADLVRWCGENGALLVTNNATDFEQLHTTIDHAGLLVYRDQSRPDTDPEGLARTVDEVLTQYGEEQLRNELVDLDEWYDWLHD
jgi:predicted nuclease of predicted toxin-antitoxin system